MVMCRIWCAIAIDRLALTVSHGWHRYRWCVRTSDNGLVRGSRMTDRKSCSLTTPRDRCLIARTTRRHMFASICGDESLC